MGKISVLLVDDHPVVRQGVAALLSAHEDIDIVGEAGDGKQAIALAQETRPDVVLMDLSLPLLNGVQATRRIRHELPSTKILVLTSYGHDEYLRQALQAGAHGFLLKQTAADELLVAIRHVFDGNSYISKQLSKALARLASESERKRPAKSPSNLTLREGQILQLISDGFSNKQIGAQLGISVKTVEKHRQKLMNKLGIHETAGLTRYALALESL